MTRTPDPAPFTPSQLRALLGSAAQELIWGLRAVRHEHCFWLRRAAVIPDPDLRRCAVAALQDKRPLLDGAALFWTLADRRRPDLLRLLVAFQVLANYHDHASERAGAGTTRADPGATMAHFAEVVDLRRAPHHYQPSSAHQDGGYLAELVGVCRDGCRRLARYDAARHHLVLAARRAQSLDLEHVADRELRPQMLRTFAGDAFGTHGDLEWFELTAGSSSLLTAIVLLALAAKPASTPIELSTAVRVYTVVATISALLDNYVDYEDDLDTGSHNYLNYYGSLASAVPRIAELVRTTMDQLGGLPQVGRHRVIVASMVAMYLTSDGARAKDPQAIRMLVRSGGRLTRALIPVLSAWRMVGRERGA